MKIPRYWKQVYKHVEGINFHEDQLKSKDDTSADVFAWGYSDTSEEKALERAHSRIDEIVAAVSSKNDENFYYPLNVLHEDILEELSTKGKGRALVTRNRYFSRVLNTDDMMFVDIDVPLWDIKPASFWQKLFGKASAVEAQNALEIDRRFNCVLASVKKYTDREPRTGFLVYRTSAGFRLIASHKTFDPKSEESQKIFDALGTDPLYQKLCKAQECFRARLTPKYWRMDVDLGSSPSIRFRINESILAKWSENDESRVEEYDKWIEVYDRQHLGHATCQFIEHMGNRKIAEELLDLIHYHDQVTQSHSGKPLA